MHAASPVGGRLMTRRFQVMLAFLAIAVVLLAVRFTFGIGSTTALSDGYPWGIWIAFDVVTGTAIACGGYAVAILVYIMNRGRYHPLVRSALVTSALGYTLAGLSVVIDLGRWWNVYSVPIKFWEWNLNSILLEVALCIMLYMMVLWIELSPAFLERGRTAANSRLRAASEWALPKVNRAMPWIIALGLVLPTMHQSSLGSLMMLAGPRLHDLWLTPLLPALFLISCLAMGYAGVILESMLSSWSFRTPSELPLLRRLALPAAGVIVLWAVVRVVDIVARGNFEHVLAFDGMSFLFLGEVSLLLFGAFLLFRNWRHATSRQLFNAAVVVLFGGALYRFSTFLIAFNPGQWSYFPAVPELLITIGLVSAEIMAYIALVRFFPILQGARSGLPTKAGQSLPAAVAAGVRPAPVAAGPAAATPASAPTTPWARGGD